MDTNETEDRAEAPDPIRDRDAKILAEEAEQAWFYRRSVLKDMPWNLGCGNCQADFCDHISPNEYRAWREHFTAKHGEDWYLEHESLIEYGRELLRQEQAEEKARKAEEAAQAAAGPNVYAEARKLLPPPPGDDYSEFQKAYEGLMHETVRKVWKGWSDDPLPERLQRLDEVETSPPQAIVSPFVNDEGATAIFGDGSSAKSTLVAAIAATAATTARFSALQRTEEPRPVILLPYEGRKGLARRVLSFANGADTDLIRVVPNRLMLGTIWQDAERLSEYVKAEFSDHGGPVGLVIVDSVGYAIGSEGAASDVAATQFGAALDRIGLPALCVAHQTKNGETSKPFGSVYWHNTFRMTWHIERNADTGVLTLVCRKDNEGEMQGQKRVMQVEYEMTDEGSVPRNVRAVEGTRDSVAERMHTLLVTMGALPTGDLARALDVPEDTIRKTVTRHLDIFERDKRLIRAKGAKR